MWFDEADWNIVENDLYECFLDGGDLILSLGFASHQWLLEESNKLRKVEFIHRIKIFENWQTDIKFGPYLRNYLIDLSLLIECFLQFLRVL